MRWEHLVSFAGSSAKISAHSQGDDLHSGKSDRNGARPRAFSSIGSRQQAQLSHARTK